MMCHVECQKRRLACTERKRTGAAQLVALVGTNERMNGAAYVAEEAGWQKKKKKDIKKTVARRRRRRWSSSGLIVVVVAFTGFGGWLGLDICPEPADIFNGLAFFSHTGHTGHSTHIRHMIAVYSVCT